LRNNIILKNVDSVNYLGTVISSNNSSVQHVNKTISKSNQTIMFIQMLSGCRFGVHPSKSLLFYKAFIITRYEYACSFFSNISKSVQNNINKHANFHLRKTLGLIKSTPINIIYNLAA